MDMGVLRSGIGTGIESGCGVNIADSGRSPRSPSNASLYWERTGSVEVRVLDTVHTRSILLSSIVIRSIFCAVDSPVSERGRWSSFTTTNSTLYFFDVLGFLSTRPHLPRGSISAPFHMINFEEVCCNFRGACLWVMVFTLAPVSIRKVTGETQFLPVSIRHFSCLPSDELTAWIHSVYLSEVYSKSASCTTVKSLI